MQITTITQKGQVTIPASIRKSLGLKPGRKISFEQKKDKVVIKPTVDFFALRGSLKTKKPFNIKAMTKAAERLATSEYAKKHSKVN